MKKLALACATATALLLGTLVVGVGPTSAASSTIGYTTIPNPDGTCDLATIDLRTGVVTDLPAPSSTDACVTDLAADPQGRVWGIGIDGFSLGDALLTPAAEPSLESRIVAFSADGAATSTPVIWPDTLTNPSLAYGGIAIDPELGIVIMASNGAADPGCDFSTCVMRYDPGTGVATLIGGTGAFSRGQVFLTSCTSGIYTLLLNLRVEVRAVSRTTGEPLGGFFTLGAANGFDCIPGTDTLFGLAYSEAVSSLNAQSAAQSIGTIDPSTGEYTQIAEVSGAETEIFTLAVAATPVPTTTTSQPAAVQAATVTPAFTG